MGSDTDWMRSGCEYFDFWVSYNLARNGKQKLLIYAPISEQKRVNKMKMKLDIITQFSVFYVATCCTDDTVTVPWFITCLR